MSDTKVQNMTALTTASADDILYVVDDPGGTPVDRKITIANLAASSALIPLTTRGDLLTRDASALTRLALGGISGSLLTRNATDVLWSAGALSFGGAYTLTIGADSSISGTAIVGAPGTLTVATTNSATAPHTHAVTSVSSSTAAASLLSCNASGYLQLLGLGVGAAPTALAPFSGTITVTDTASNTYDGFLGASYLNPAAPSTANINGGRFVCTVQGGANTIGLAYGLNLLVYHYNTAATSSTGAVFTNYKMDAGATVQLTAAQATVVVNTGSTGSLTRAYVFQTTLQNNAAINTTRGYSIVVTTPTKSGGGTFTEVIGLYIQNQSAATTASNNYAIFMDAQSGWGIYAGTAASGSRFGHHLSLVGSTDVQQFLVTGHTTQAVATTVAQITRADAAAGVSAMLGLTALGSGAAGDGGSVLLNGKSSTTAATAMARLRWKWDTATHASRAAALILSAYDTAERDIIEIGGNGSAGTLGFFAATKVVKQTGCAVPTDLATCIAAITALRTALNNYGLTTVV